MTKNRQPLENRGGTLLLIAAIIGVAIAILAFACSDTDSPSQRSRPSPATSSKPAERQATTRPAPAKPAARTPQPQGTMLSRSDAETLATAAVMQCARYGMTATTTDCVLSSFDDYCRDTFSRSRCKSELMAAVERLAG